MARAVFCGPVLGKLFYRLGAGVSLCELLPRLAPCIGLSAGLSHPFFFGNWMVSVLGLVHFPSGWDAYLRRISRSYSNWVFTAPIIFVYAGNIGPIDFFITYLGLLPMRCW